MTRRISRTLGALAVGLLLSVGAAPVAMGAPVASAAPVALGGSAAAVSWHSLPGHPAAAVLRWAGGYCDPADTGSVTVVVDFGTLGGGVRISCSSGATGQQALSKVFSYSEVRSQPGFVCQIEGKPTSDCQTTPPTSAYWSYWQAAPGGGWTYSSRGFGSSRVKPGGFEGWSYGSGSAPGVDPVLPAPPKPEPPAPEPKPPAAPAPQPEPPAPAPQPKPPAAPAPEPKAAPEQPAPKQPAPEPIAANPAVPDAGTPDGNVAVTPDANTQSTTSEAAPATAAPPPATDPTTSAAPQSSAVASSAGSTVIVPGVVGGSSGSAVSSGSAAPLASGEGTSGSTIWITIGALAVLGGLGGAAVVMSRRRSTPSDD